MKSPSKLTLISFAFIAVIPVAFYSASYYRREQLNQKLLADATRGYVAPARSWLERGADPNIRDEENYGTPILSTVAATGRIELVNLLLDKGANIEVRDPHGNTPLMYAAVSGQMQSVQFLLSRGANPLVKNNYGHTVRIKAEAHLKKLLRARDKDKWVADIKARQRIVLLLKQAEQK